jgi:small subunit ribosomal protein S5
VDLYFNHNIMTEETNIIIDTPVELDTTVSSEQGAAAVSGGNTSRDPRRNTRRPSRDRRDTREPRVKPEFDQKIISIRRVTRVVTGGRRFSFSVAVVVGDKKGKVGVGQGKATDTPLAIDKAARDAKKNMIKIPLTKTHSIPHEVFAKFSGSQVKIMRAPGKGILAGSSVRTVLELAGIKEVGSKLFSRSKNKVNNAKAAIKALSLIRAK